MTGRGSVFLVIGRGIVGAVVVFAVVSVFIHISIITQGCDTLGQS